MLALIKRINKIKYILSNTKVFKKVIELGFYGYLNEVGWTRSVDNHAPVDKEGNPVPWVTYGYIDFIDNRLKSDFSVYEYGSGASTLWYSKRVGNIVSVEHDKMWYDEVKSELPENCELKFRDLSGDIYEKSICEHDTLFDLIIIDGRKRVECIKYALRKVSGRGVIVLDDSDRSQYTQGIDLLTSNGFKRLDFWGLAPGITYKKCTSVFYRQGNCLGI